MVVDSGKNKWWHLLLQPENTNQSQQVPSQLTRRVELSLGSCHMGENNQ